MKVTDAIVGTVTMDMDIDKVAPGYFLSTGADDRTYYLFARTSKDPYRYFYRTLPAQPAMSGQLDSDGSAASKPIGSPH